MTSSVTVQLLGNLAILALAALLAVIAHSGPRFSQYGREALFCAAGYLASTVAVRTLSVFNLVSSADSRAVTGVVAFGFLGVMVQIGALYRLDRRHRPHP